ncbi:MAG: alanine--tRNA ligase-related protein [Phycisphaerales bacterium]|nr:alanine--tRNA ligase-related protein [Phycisphaerales bacterium]
MITQQEIINRFFSFTSKRGYCKKERSNLVSPYFDNEFNLSAGHQYVLPILKNPEKEELVKIAINEICIRRIDLEKLGASACHLLTFEMGVMGIFGYIDDLKPTLSTLLQDMLDLLVFFGFSMDDIYFSVCDGVTVLHKKYPADTLSYELLLEKGVKDSHLVKTKGRQNFIFSNGEERPAGNSIEIYYKRNSTYTEIASVNVYKYLFSDGKLHPMTNQAIGGGFGFDRIPYLLNGCNSVFDIPPFSTFAERIASCFASEIEFELNRDKIYRMIELIKTLLFIENDGQLPDSTPHGKIMKGFLNKLNSEIGYLGLEQKKIFDLGVSSVREHYSTRYLLEKRASL